MLLLLLVACPKPSAPPSLFPADAPILDAPAPLEYPRAPDTCDGPIAVETGATLPILAPNGRSTCGGILLGDDDYARMLQTSRVDEPWYRTFAETCSDGRARDRAWADAAYRHQLEVDARVEQDNRALRLAEPAAFALGLLVGAGVAVTATSIEVSIAR